MAVSVGRTITDEIASALVAVVANSNRAVESIDQPAGLDFLIELKRLQRAIQSATADDVQQTATGILSPEQLLSRNTPTTLAARAAAESVGTVFPVAATIDNVTAAEPVAGSVEFEFLVSLSAPSSLPVSIDYRTQASTANDFNGDFTAVTGTITFAAGQTQQTIRVPVHADAVDEPAEDNVLIGGRGNDVLIGGHGQDLLIAGWTLHDGDLNAMVAIGNIWNSGANYPVRVEFIRSGTGVGLNGVSFAAGVSVFDDSTRDLLVGNSNTDWYFAELDRLGSDDDYIWGWHSAEMLDPL